MIHQVKGTARNRQLVMWWWGVGEGDVFCSPTIWSFSELVPTNCRLPKCFSAFFVCFWLCFVLPSFFGRRGWLEWTELSISFPPGQLGSGNAPAGWLCYLVSPEPRPCQEQSALVYSKWFFSPLWQKHFLWYFCGNLVKLLEVNPTKLRWPPDDGIPLEFLTLRVVPTNSPAICQLQFRLSHSHH